MATAVVISFRLGGTDGVSIESAKWQRALSTLGYSITTMAGTGNADVIVPGLAMRASGLQRVDIPDADVVVVENLLSLTPLNPDAARAVAGAMRGRRAVIHHHDLPWQQPAYASFDTAIADDPNWRHVTINELSRRELGQRGIDARTIYNRFDPDPELGDRASTRTRLGIGDDEHVLLHPTRAIARKNVGGALELAAAVGATYWLLGDAEPEYADELRRLIDASAVRVIHHGAPIAGAYAACDAVCLPSRWEGFGNPTVESAVYRRPLAVADYPVAHELRSFGFEWFPTDDPRPLRDWFGAPDASLLEHNAAVAREHFNLADLPDAIMAVLDD